MKKLRLVVVAILALALAVMTGCSSVTTFNRLPANASEVASLSSPVPDLHAHLVGVTTSAKGMTSKAAPPIAQWVQRGLEESGLFSEVRVEPSLLLKNTPPGKMEYLSDKVIEITANMNTTDDLHVGGNLAKAGFIGLTLYLSAPFVTYTADFTTDVEVEVVRWDGVKKTYTAGSSATARYKHFSNKILSPLKSKQASMDASLKSVLNKIIDDKEFFLGGQVSAQVAN